MKKIWFILILGTFVFGVIYGKDKDKKEKREKEGHKEHKKKHKGDKEDDHEKRKYKLVTRGAVEREYYVKQMEQTVVLPVLPHGKIVELGNCEAIFFSPNAKYYARAWSPDRDTFRFWKWPSNYEGPPPRSAIRIFRTCKVYTLANDQLQTVIRDIRKRILITNSGYVIAYDGVDPIGEIYNQSGNLVAGPFKSEIITNYQGTAGIANIGDWGKEKWAYVDFKTGQNIELLWLQNISDPSQFVLLDSNEMILSQTVDPDASEGGKPIPMNLTKYDLKGNKILEKSLKGISTSICTLAGDKFSFNHKVMDSSFRILQGLPFTAGIYYDERDRSLSPDLIWKILIDGKGIFNTNTMKDEPVVLVFYKKNHNVNSQFFLQKNYEVDSKGYVSGDLDLAQNKRVLFVASNKVFVRYGKVFYFFAINSKRKTIQMLFKGKLIEIEKKYNGEGAGLIGPEDDKEKKDKKEDRREK